MIDEGSQRRLAAILAADVVGYSRLVGIDESATLSALKAHRRELLDPKIAEHHGRIVKTTGDGMLVEFPSVVEAVQCAVEVQREMIARNAGVSPDRAIHLRIGIHQGDVVVDEGDLFGDGVNVAARLETLADPGGLCVSERVREDTAGKLSLDFEDLGSQRLRNIAHPVRVYKVVIGARAAPFSPPEKPSIGVLPFVNMSGDPEQEYFSDGITEDITTALSRLRWFFVIARNSTFIYKGKAVDVKRVGVELGVRYVLEGSVRKIGSRVRITAQLIDAANGAHLWAERYDRELTDIFALQDEITQSVTAAIEPKLVEAEGAHSQGRSPEDLDAWDLVMRAVAHFWRMTGTESELAVEMLRRAVELHPAYAPAHSLLAFALLVSEHVGWAPGGSSYQLAASLAHRAAELDDEDPWAHLALGYLAFTARRTDDAVGEFQRALDLNPSFAAACGYLGWAVVFDGRHEEAIEHFQQAMRMSPHDPLTPFFYAGMCATHYFARRFDVAVEWGRKSVQQRPGFIAGHRILCAALAQAGRTDELRAAMQQVRELQPNLSLAWLREHVPYTPRAIEHYLDGMRKAGVE